MSKLSRLASVLVQNRVPERPHRFEGLRQLLIVDESLISTRMIERFFESLPISLTITDDRGRYRHVNDAFCKLLKYTGPELQRFDENHFTHPADHAVEMELNALLIRGLKNSYQIEKRYLPQIGAPIWIRKITTLITRPIRKPKVELVSLIYDISLEKRADAELKLERDRVVSERQRFRRLTDAIPQPVWTAFANGDVDFANRSWHAFTGLMEIDLKTLGWLGAVHPEDVDKTTEVWKHSLGTLTPMAFETRLRRRDDTYRWFSIRAVPMKNDESGTVKWYGTCIDIQEQKRLAHELSESRRLLSMSGVRVETPVKPRNALAGLKVLVVEDSEDNQLLIRRVLTKNGAQTELARDGQEGLEKALDGDFDVILMDIQMPVLDGCEATRRLRQAGYKKPILALTAHALDSERRRTREAGCEEHHTKPLNIETLISSLSRYTHH